MIVGLIIILVFPFIYFYTEMSNLNSKTSTIKKAIDEGKETYIDPLTGKMHWVENGEQVIWTEILSTEKNIPEGCIVGDKVLRGVKSGKVYKNKSFEQFKAHVQRQINNGEIWCYERIDYAKKHDDCSKQHLRYHIKDKYFYTLQKIENQRIVKKTPEEIKEKRCWEKYKVVEEKKYFIIRNEIKTEITCEEYKKLGGK